MDSTKYLVYKTTNIKSGKFYIGVHQTQDINDGYLGSGLLLRRSIEKHGEDNFKREILFSFDNPDDMFKKEKELVDKNFISREDTYNLAIGGKGGWRGAEADLKQSLKMRGRKASPETRKKMSESRKGKKLKKPRSSPARRGYTGYNKGKVAVYKDGVGIYVEKSSVEQYLQEGYTSEMPKEMCQTRSHKVSEEAKALISERVKNYYKTHDNPRKGVVVSDKTRKKMSEAGKARPHISEATRAKLSKQSKGRIVSAETRKKIGDKNRGREGATKRYKTIYNRESLKERRVDMTVLDTFLAEGWVLGRSPRTKEKISNHAKKLKLED